MKRLLNDAEPWLTVGFKLFCTFALREECVTSAKLEENAPGIEIGHSALWTETEWKTGKQQIKDCTLKSKENIFYYKRLFNPIISLVNLFWNAILSHSRLQPSDNQKSSCNFFFCRVPVIYWQHLLIYCHLLSYAFLFHLTHTNFAAIV